jgi:hypothetical protein
MSLIFVIVGGLLGVLLSAVVRASFGPRGWSGSRKCSLLIAGNRGANGASSLGPGKPGTRPCFGRGRQFADSPMEPGRTPPFPAVLSEGT